jgi:hypothetical protein
MMSGEIMMLARDAFHPSSVRMRMVIIRALRIGQRRRGLLIKTQAPRYPSALLSHPRQDRADAMSAAGFIPA